MTTGDIRTCTIRNLVPAFHGIETLKNLVGSVENNSPIDMVLLLHCGDAPEWEQLVAIVAAAVVSLVHCCG